MEFILFNLGVAILALGLERVFGYPGLLFSVIRHPVVWLGALISLFDKRLNRPQASDRNKRLFGILMVLIVFCATLFTTALLTLYLRSFPIGLFLEALLATSLLSQKSLKEYVQAVYEGLSESLCKGQEAVRHIVGRDPKVLDESGVAKAAVESLAENSSDGIVAPVFWLALFGLSGAAVYKAVNTMDSMVGYKNNEYLAFGWASARLDDVLNFIPSRLCGILFVMTALLSRRWQGNGAWIAMRRDAKNHVSPNAGWPEAAMAGGLGLSLGGARSYGGTEIHLATMGNGRTTLKANDIRTAILFYDRSMTLCLFVLAAIFGLVFAVTRFSI